MHDSSTINCYQGLLQKYYAFTTPAHTGSSWQVRRKSSPGQLFTVSEWTGRTAAVFLNIYTPLVHHHRPCSLCCWPVSSSASTPWSLTSMAYVLPLSVWWQFSVKYSSSRLEAAWSTRIFGSAFRLVSFAPSALVVRISQVSPSHWQVQRSQCDFPQFGPPRSFIHHIFHPQRSLQFACTGLW
jgi:hypothetical protein